MTHTSKTDFEMSTKKGWQELLVILCRLSHKRESSRVPHSELLRHVAKLWKAREMKERMEELLERQLVEVAELGRFRRREYRLVPAFARQLQEFVERAESEGITEENYPSGWEVSEALIYCMERGLTDEEGTLKKEKKEKQSHV